MDDYEGVGPLKEDAAALLLELAGVRSPAPEGGRRDEAAGGGGDEEGGGGVRRAEVRYGFRSRRSSCTVQQVPARKLRRLPKKSAGRAKRASR
jgi:hypothetical protein